MTCKTNAATLAFSGLLNAVKEGRVSEQNCDSYVLNSLITYLTCTERSLEDLLKTQDAANYSRVTFNK